MDKYISWQYVNIDFRKDDIFNSNINLNLFIYLWDNMNMIYEEMIKNIAIEMFLVCLRNESFFIFKSYNIIFPS